MALPANIRLQVAKNGGPPATGAITATFSDSIVLSLVESAGVNKAKWEIYEYPEGWPCPSGWTAASNGRYFVTTLNGAPAPVFSLPADTALWGKFLLSVEVNDRKRSGETAEDLFDNRTAIKILSPGGLEDVAYLEGSQFDPKRRWVGALKSLIRAVESIGGGGGGGLNIAGAGLTESPVGTANVVAHADGSIIVGPNDVRVGVLATDAQHGNRGGGALHAAVANTAAGFAAAITGAALALLSNGGGTAATWAKITNTHIDTAAAVAVSKLAAGTDGHVLTTVAGVPTWAAPSGGGAGLTVAGAGLTESPAGTVNVVGDASISVAANSISVGVINASQHGTQTSGSLHAAVTNAAGGFAPSITAGDRALVSNAGGTLSQWSQISNPHVAAAAAIAGTKIDPNFGNQNIRAGILPANVGRIRLGINDLINWRNIDNTADIPAISVRDGGIFGNTLWLGSDTVTRADTVIVDSTGGSFLSVGGTAKFFVGSTLATVATPLAFGSFAALSGDIRLPHASSLKALNFAGTFDRQLIGWGMGGTNDLLELGDGTTALRIRGLSGSTALYVGSTSVLTVASTGLTIDSGANLTWNAAIASPLLSQANTAGTAQNFTMRAQGDTSAGNGGAFQIDGGRHTSGLRGAVRLRLNPDDAAFEPMVELCEVVSGNRVLALCRLANLTATQMPASTGDGVIYVGDCNTQATANPVGGVVVYAKSSGGTGVGEGLRIRTPNGEGALGSCDGTTDGQDFYLYAGAGTSTGGDIFITAGGSASTDTGGSVNIRAGNCDTTAGAVSLIDHNGANKLKINNVGIGFNAATPIARPDYTITNPTTDRALNVTGDTLAQGLAVLGTVIQDLIDYGLYQ